MKKKVGTGAERVKGKKPVTALTSTQFALGQAIKRIVALEKQSDGLARLDKQKDIRMNGLALKMKRLEERVYGRDSE